MKKAIAFLLMLCLLAAPALALELTPEEILAEQWMLDADPEAANADDIFVFPSRETDGAWVFCCMKHHLISAGEFWYLTGDEAYSLGSGKHFDDWELLNTTPEVFCCSIERLGRNYARASILVDGKPFQLKGAEKLADLREYLGCMYGRIDGFDYAFLCVDNNELCEVEAIEITMEQYLTLDGAPEILDVLEQHSPGAKVLSILYRSTGVITMNVDTRDGKQFMHVWKDENGRLVEELSFGDMLALYDGTGTATRNTGLRVIESVFPE